MIRTLCCRQTWTSHPWVVRENVSRVVIAYYRGSDAVLTLNPAAEDEQQKHDAERQCVIYWDAHANARFMPCGHKICCSACIEALIAHSTPSAPAQWSPECP